MSMEVCYHNGREWMWRMERDIGKIEIMLIEEENAREARRQQREEEAEREAELAAEEERLAAELDDLDRAGTP